MVVHKVFYFSKTQKQMYDFLKTFLNDYEVHIPQPILYEQENLYLEVRKNKDFIFQDYYKPFKW